VNVRGCANLIAILAMPVWWLLFLRAASHYRHVATFGYPGATGEWDFWVYMPLGMTVGLLLCAVLVNTVAKPFAWHLGVLALGSLPVVLWYLLMTSGGV
jgi:hypothetical protein